MLTSSGSNNSLRSRLKQYNSDYKALSQKFTLQAAQLESLTVEKLCQIQENINLQDENSRLHQQLDILLQTTELEILKIKNIDRILSLHWDYSMQECINCSLKFGIFSRRHHCRKCGHAMCSNCSVEHEMSVLTRELKEANSGFQKFKVCKKCLCL
jgi:hypothetical protein